MLLTACVAVPRARRRCSDRGAASARCCAAPSSPLSALLGAAGGSSALVVGEGALGRGLFATADAREGDLLLRVPLRHCCVVTTGGSRALVEGLLRQWKADGCALPPGLAAFVQDLRQPPAPRLAAWLLWARTAAPVWRCVDALLPPGSFRVEAAVQAAEDAHAAFAATAASDAQLAFSAQDFAWALSCVASRTFGADAWTRGEQDGVLGVLAPAADLLNHRFDPNCHFRLRNDAGQFEVFARTELAAGQEACISYGETLTNQELLHRYGFSLGDANPNGEVTKAPKRRVNW